MRMQPAFGPEDPSAVTAMLRLTGGAGADAVFLTASTKSNQPIELAVELSRERGRVVCLGNTQINLDWRAWFAKEVDFLFSRAMGPGIFDADYFTRGRDYPVGYVRWSANRNMAAFLDLIAQQKVNLRKLITHRQPFSEAKSVFDKIANGELASAVGIVFEYTDADKDIPSGRLRTIEFDGSATRKKVELAVIGAGNYAKSMILPHLVAHRNLSLEAICTARGMNAQALAQRYGFRKATTDAAELTADAAINAVAVATRHDSHAHFARQALQAGKSVYVEKPLAMNEEQLAPILELVRNREAHGNSLWVGYNRRFAPMSRRALEHMRPVPVRQVACTVRAASVPADSWYQDPSEGGGILFGDVCHFIDLVIWFQQSLPVEVHAVATRDPGHREDSWAVQMRFANGGLGTVSYVCGSEQGWERETIDILGGGRSARISGFRKLTLNDGRRSRHENAIQPDLGQKAMIEAMLAQFARTPGAEDHTDSFLVGTAALLAAHRSIQERRVVLIEPAFPYALD